MGGGFIGEGEGERKKPKENHCQVANVICQILAVESEIYVQKLEERKRLTPGESE